jgi:hypothetical protein
MEKSELSGFDLRPDCRLKWQPAGLGRLLSHDLLHSGRCRDTNKPDRLTGHIDPSLPVVIDGFRALILWGSTAGREQNTGVRRVRLRVLIKGLLKFDSI